MAILAPEMTASSWYQDFQFFFHAYHAFFTIQGLKCWQLWQNNDISCSLSRQGHQNVDSLLVPISIWLQKMYFLVKYLLTKIDLTGFCCDRSGAEKEEVLLFSFIDSSSKLRQKYKKSPQNTFQNSTVSSMSLTLFYHLFPVGQHICGKTA